jgi:hypothetical protein
VKAALQVGDLTNFNLSSEWARAQSIFSKLDNKIDYIFCTGNHDYGLNGSTNIRDTPFSKYFNYKNNSIFHSSFEKNNYENTYFKFNKQNLPFQIFSLEFAPRNSVIAWADSLAKSDPNSIGIVLTHAYLANASNRYNYEKFKNTQLYSPYSYLISKSEKINDGEEIWNKLVYANRNIRYIFCGHNLIPNNNFYLFSENNTKKQVLQIIFNKQESKYGGEGSIKIIEFKDNHTACSKTYSTLYNQWENIDDQVNDFKYN